MNPSTLMSYLVVGAVVGAALAFLRVIFSDAESSWPTFRKSAMAGAGVGMVFFLVSSGGVSSSAMDASTPEVKSIGTDTFQKEVIDSSQPVLVDFYATWCGPCRMMSPRVDSVAKDLAGKVKFVKVNVDNAQALAQKYEIHGIPALLLFKHGKVVDTMIGLQSEESLKSHLHP